jgi:hypothetical protein
MKTASILLAMAVSLGFVMKAEAKNPRFGYVVKRK